MCGAMATRFESQEGVLGNHLKRKLAATVRSIQWSYAIFWFNSPKGRLEWGDGYYNGEIKTMKTVQPMELSVDEMGLQRSEQLRELYKSLSMGDSVQQVKRPCAALSPEDLTATEWYYLVCMSFTFKPSQGMPGRALANGRHIWLCDTHHADSKVFMRSLLAKSASIQTVVCFPLMGGVLELGVTELISEDPSLLQHIKTNFSELSEPVCSEQSTSSPCNVDKDEDHSRTEVGHEIVNSMPKGGLHEFPCRIQYHAPEEEIKDDVERIEIPTNVGEELKMDSSGDSSMGCCHYQNTDDYFMIAGVTSTPQVQYIDDEFSNILHGSANSSNCTSQSVINPEKAILSSPNGESSSDLKECNHTKLSLLDLETQDSHYSKTLLTVLQNSYHFTAKSCFWNGSHESSFMVWRKGLDTQKQQISTTQKMLKKVLFDVPWMHGRCPPKSQEILSKRDWKHRDGDVSMSYVTMNEKLNEKFFILRSAVPSSSKVEKASILDDTIAYLKELEKRVHELEARKECGESEERKRKKHPDIVERTSDNYHQDHGQNEISHRSKHSLNKRRASDIGEMDAGINSLLSKESLADMTITVVEKEVMIEMRCPWREGLLLELVDAINSLNLDARSVQSSSVDGILTMRLTSKFKGAAVASVGMIKQTLQKVVGKFG